MSGQQHGDSDGDTVVVGLISDPGTPADTIARLTDELPDQLASSTGTGNVWRVEQSVEVLPLDAEGEIALLPRAQELREKYGWDLLVYLTDLPRLEDGQPVLADISMENGVALVSLPALGMLLLRRVRDSIAVVVATMHSGSDETRQIRGRTPKGLLKSPRARDSSGPEIATYTAVVGLRGRLRLVFGLVRSNRPWRLLPSLSSTAAAAFATGAFGVFFTSIWGLAASMSWWRLTTVTVISILIMTAWLIGYSGLIERPGGKDTARRAPLYNAATTVSVMTSVVLVYASLFAVLALAALIIIPFHFMETELMRAPTVRDYLVVPWLSASMGVTAGAFGSSFDDENEVRSATFSQREYERYQAVSDDDENGSSASEERAEDTSTP